MADFTFEEAAAAPPATPAKSGFSFEEAQGAKATQKPLEGPSGLQKAAVAFEPAVTALANVGKGLQAGGKEFVAGLDKMAGGALRTLTGNKPLEALGQVGFGFLEAMGGVGSLVNAPIKELGVRPLATAINPTLEKATGRVMNPDAVSGLVEMAAPLAGLTKVGQLALTSKQGAGGFRQGVDELGKLLFVTPEAPKVASGEKFRTVPETSKSVPTKGSGVEYALDQNGNLTPTKLAPKQDVKATIEKSVGVKTAEEQKAFAEEKLAGAQEAFGKEMDELLQGPQKPEVLVPDYTVMFKSWSDFVDSHNLPAEKQESLALVYQKSYSALFKETGDAALAEKAVNEWLGKGLTTKETPPLEEYTDKLLGKKTPPHNAPITPGQTQSVEVDYGYLEDSFAKWVAPYSFTSQKELLQLSVNYEKFYKLGVAGGQTNEQAAANAAKVLQKDLEKVSGKVPETHPTMQPATSKKSQGLLGNVLQNFYSTAHVQFQPETIGKLQELEIELKAVAKKNGLTNYQTQKFMTGILEDEIVDAAWFIKQGKESEWAPEPTAVSKKAFWQPTAEALHQLADLPETTVEAVTKKPASGVVKNGYQRQPGETLESALGKIIKGGHDGLTFIDAAGEEHVLKKFTPATARAALKKAEAGKNMVGVDSAGQAIAPSSLGIYNFWKWFGNSILKNKEGKPLLLYHGTPAGNIQYFNIKNVSGPFIFASSSKDFASHFAASGGAIMRLYMKAEHPFNPHNEAALDSLRQKLGLAADDYGWGLTKKQLLNKDTNWMGIEAHEVIQALKDLGHDSFMTKEHGVTNVAVFDPRQIKAAPGTKGLHGEHKAGNIGLFGPSKYIAGRASMPMMNSIAGAAVGATLDPEDRVRGAMIGAAAGYWLSRGIGRPAEALLEKQATKEGRLLLDELKNDSWLPSFKNITARSLGLALDWTRYAGQADTTALFNHVSAARKAGVTPEIDAKFRALSEGSAQTLTAHEAALYSKYVVPMRETMADLLNQIKDPKEREILAGEINTRLAKNHRAWWDTVMEGGQMKGPKGFAKSPSSIAPLKAMQLADGTVVTQKHLGTGQWAVMGWKDGNATPLGTAMERLAPGAEFNGQQVIKGTSQAIEAHTPIRYVQSELGTMAVKNSELRKYVREISLVKDLVESPEGKKLFVKAEPHNVPEGWVQVGDVGLPGMGELYTTPEMREVLQDFKKRSTGLEDLAERFNAGVVRALMINPIVHLGNEIPHWLKARGISGLLTPTGIPQGASQGLKGLITTMADATHSVLTQDHFQRELAKHGQNLLYMNTRNAAAWGEILQVGLKQAVATKDFKEIAKAVGVAPARLAERVSTNSALVMWGVRDIFVTQLVKEKMAMGFDMASAVREVERSMPMYNLPSRVMLPGQAGRATSLILQTPLVSIFSRYHYGMVNGLKEVAKEVASPLVPGAKNELVKGLDQVAVIAAGLTVLYPMLDNMWQNILDNPNVKQRRGGPFHPIEALHEWYSGERNWPQVFTSVWTPAPAFTTAAEVPYNRQLFSGQPIMTPGADARTQTIEAARYLTGKYAPAASAQSIAEGRQTPEQVMLRQLDVIETTPEQLARKEKAKKFAERRARAQEKKLKQVYGD